jgi:hypothetical protein
MKLSLRMPIHLVEYERTMREGREDLFGLDRGWFEDGKHIIPMHGRRVAACLEYLDGK